MDVSHWPEGTSEAHVTNLREIFDGYLVSISHMAQDFYRPLGSLSTSMMTEGLSRFTSAQPAESNKR